MDGNIRGRAQSVSFGRNDQESEFHSSPVGLHSFKMELSARSPRRQVVWEELDLEKGGEAKRRGRELGVLEEFSALWFWMLTRSVGGAEKGQHHRRSSRS